MATVLGWATLDALRAEPRTADVPVIVCTVKAGDDDRAEAWRRGADGFVAKPFRISELEQEVRSILGRTPTEREALCRARQGRTGSTPS